MDAALFAQQVIDYVSHFHGSVTSWIRTPEHNRAVGGVETSPHIFGLGADVVYDAVPELAAAQAFAAALGLHVVREHDHDHLQPVDWFTNDAYRTVRTA